ncbi:uncharacterized protein LOC112055753 [Bicyclus anynana]|uniref:Uncharacterized protein LOC112055753 n=1 Tax=Bicyclus anynana TaxID=110368 RepID=A0A6J1NVI8_BICAN|nr:uncharacterized protein LOC112055753 [Bicyclus anynana]
MLYAVHPHALCKPTQVVKGPCHECICREDGLFVCHAVPCPLSVVNPRKSSKDECQPHVTYKYEELLCTCNYEGRWGSFNCRETFRYLRSDNKSVKRDLKSDYIYIFSNQHEIDHNDLPEIQDGESCVQGKVYKMLCNTCQCGERNKLMCTKMSCFENTIQTALRQAKEESDKKENKEKLNNGVLPKALRQVKDDEKKKVIKGVNSGALRKGSSKKKLLTLPKGKCVPGMIYSSGCKKCFCDDKEKAKCTRSCSGELPNRFSDKDISEMETRSVIDLPELPHMGAKCDPGKSYYVVCNICFCSHKHDLICTMKYCIDLDSATNVQSKELTGRPCKKDFKFLCADCKCVNNQNQCKPIPNCGNHMSGKQLLSSAAGTNMKLTLDIQKEKCKPNVSYKFHCNECHCQPDGSLRCTQKICLTYSQAKDLQDRETYLDKHGL